MPVDLEDLILWAKEWQLAGFRTDIYPHLEQVYFMDGLDWGISITRVADSPLWGPWTVTVYGEWQRGQNVQSLEEALELADGLLRERK